MTKSSVKVRIVEPQEIGSGSRCRSGSCSGAKQSRRKKQRTTATTATPPAKPHVDTILEISSDDDSEEEEEEEETEEDNEEEDEEDEASEEEEQRRQPLKGNLKGQGKNPPKGNSKGQGKNPPKGNPKGQGKNPPKSDVGRKNAPISVTLTDDDVLDCPICLEKPTDNVFQCENGHIACNSCCVKINKTCPSCSCPIEYRCRVLENILEAMLVPCKYAEHGCDKLLSYSKKSDHEDMCTYLQCSCPIPECEFQANALDLYQHFTEKHPAPQAVDFRFRYRFSVSLQTGQEFLVLREKTLGTLFVLTLFTLEQGQLVVSIVVIGPKSSSRNYRYELAAKDDGQTQSIAFHSQVESIPKLADFSRSRYFLVVDADGIPQLDFDIRIRPSVDCCP